LKRIFQLGKFSHPKKGKKKKEKQSHIQSPNKEPSEAPKVIVNRTPLEILEGKASPTVGFLGPYV
jgi:hypothetical protein